VPQRVKALSSPKVTSELVAECLNAFSALAGLNEVTLVWVPRHCGIFGNEEADKLAKQVSAMSLPDPEPGLGIPKCLTREAIRTWFANQHYGAWKDLSGHKYGKLFIGRLYKKRADMLQLSGH
jgi:hypothetical protein